MINCRSYVASCSPFWKKKTSEARGMITKFVILLLLTLVVVHGGKRHREERQESSSSTETSNDPSRMNDPDPGEKYKKTSTCAELTQELKERYTSDEEDDNCTDTVKSFLRDYCSTSTADPQCTTTTIPTSNISQTTEPSASSTVSSSPSPGLQPTPSTASTTTRPVNPTSLPNNYNINSQLLPKTAVGSISMATKVLILGALLGLTLVLLALVTMGWVCTCLIMKKRSRIKGVSTGDTETEEKYFDNPTYDGTSMIRLQHGSNLGPGAYKVPVLPVATTRQPQAVPRDMAYDAVNSAPPKAIGKGQTYDVLDRGRVNGKPRTVRNVRALQGYSQLGLPDKDVEGNYHLISKEND